MRRTNLVCMFGVMLNFVIAYCRIFFNDHFYYLVGKAFRYAKCVMGFGDLYFSTLTDVNEVSRLRENVLFPCIGYVINIHRMLRNLARTDMNENTFVNK